MEASLRQLERERALLQHQSAESLRKVEMEAERKRSLENERTSPNRFSADRPWMSRVVLNTPSFASQ